VFANLASVYRMTNIRGSGGIDAVAGAPERTPDGGFGIVVYWGQGGNRLDDVPAEVVRR
jgi:hypothetical protein